MAPPAWCWELEAAEAWGMAPWAVEETASVVWMERFMEWQNAKASRMSGGKPRAASRGHGRVEERRTRLG